MLHCRNAVVREFHPQHTDRSTEAHGGWPRVGKKLLLQLPANLGNPNLSSSLGLPLITCVPTPHVSSPCSLKTNPASTSPFHPSRKPTVKCALGSSG